MKTILATLAAVAAVTAVAAPAAAQSYDRDYGRHEQGRYEQGRHDRYQRDAYSIDARQAQIERRIDIAERRGLLTRAELRELHQGVRSIMRIEANYRVDGLTRRERADLDRRLDWLETRLEGRANNRDYARR